MPHIRDPVTGLCVVCDRGKRPVPYRQATRNGGIPEPNPPWNKIQRQSKMRKELQLREKEDKALKVLLLNDKHANGYLSIDQGGQSRPNPLDRVLNPHSYHDVSHAKAPPSLQGISAQPMIKDPDNFNYMFSRSKDFSAENGYIPSNRGSYHNDLSPQVVYVPVVKPEEGDDNWFQEYASHNAKLETELQDPFYRNMAENPTYFVTRRSTRAQKLFDTAARRPSLQKPKIPPVQSINQGGRPIWSYNNRPQVNLSSNRRYPHNLPDYTNQDHHQRSSSYPASLGARNGNHLEYHDPDNTIPRLNVEDIHKSNSFSVKSSLSGQNKRSPTQPTQRSVRFADEFPYNSQPRLFGKDQKHFIDDDSDSEFYGNQDQSRACTIL